MTDYKMIFPDANANAIYDKWVIIGTNLHSLNSPITNLNHTLFGVDTYFDKFIIILKFVQKCAVKNVLPIISSFIIHMTVTRAKHLIILYL